MKQPFQMVALGAMMIAAVGCTQQVTPAQEQYTQYVNTHIGTGGHGHVFLGANVPFGMVQLGPTSIPQEWDWTSGYHISDSTVIGFSHTHLTGTGIGDLFDITVMPVTGEVVYARGTEADPQSGVWSYSDRSREVSLPGYYATNLIRYDVDVELTATNRVGFHKYTFNQPEDAAVVFDLVNGGCWDSPTSASITRVNDTQLEGWRHSTGWASDQRVFFVAEFSQPMTAFEATEGKLIYGRASFDAKADTPIYMKVALSPVSIGNARQNLAAELPGWDFEKTVADADAAWNNELSKVKFETADATDKTIFYTSLYHTMIAPSTFNDVNGDYYGADHEYHKGEGFTNYTTLSCWDTYRAAYPLMTLIHPEKMKDMMTAFITIYKQQGKLPVWHLMGCETNTMVGNPGISIVADGALKGYIDDMPAAYEALKNSAMLDERGMDLRKQYGYIPYDKMGESVANDMEYAVADWAVAQVAKQMGNEEDYRYFFNRSRSYQHFYDAETGFMRGKSSDGKFRPASTFNPYASTHRADDYCEGNAWQYTFLAPHDVEGLAQCFGSEEAMLKRLDELFAADAGLQGDEISPDITGLIGQYVHGNEPDHHAIYFYTMLGAPHKTADRVREVLATFYKNEPDGLAGNEDVGQMSAWYVLSSLGFYQVEPAGGRYFFGSPLMDKATLKVRDGEFTIIAHNNSKENKYIQSITLNGQPYTQAWIDFEDIAKGGTLEITMGNQPVKWF